MSSGAPEVFTAIVDDEYLDVLFGDVERACSNLVIRLRGRDERQSDAVAVTLAAARGALRAGVGVQMRYEHDGVSWSDTLSVTPEGVQLVRCQLPVA